MHLLELFAALGAAQGFLLLLLIILRYRHPKSTPLALLLLVFSLRLGTIPSWNPQTLIAHPWLFPATTPLPFLFGPLLWWSVRELAAGAGSGGTARSRPGSVAGGGSTGRPRLLPLHFLPYAAETVAVTATVLTLTAARTPAAALPAAAYVAFVEDVFHGSPPLWLPLRNALKVAVNAVYLVLAARIAFGSPAGALDEGRRRWLRALVLVSVASLIPFAFVAVGPGATADLAHGVTLPFALLAAAMALLIYTCTVLVLLTPGVPGCPERTRRAAAPDAPREPGGRVAKAEATEDCLPLATRARRELEAGAFRDPDMSLQNLAERLGVHPNRLSRAVNHVYGESLPCLLSHCRLDYFIRRVRTGCLDDCNILELAFEAGFSSKSTFNRVFKAQYGVPPSVFARGAAKRRAPQTRLPSAAAGLATRTQRATMPVNGNGTNRSVQRHPDPAFARDARGHGRG